MNSRTNQNTLMKIFIYAFLLLSFLNLPASAQVDTSTIERELAGYWEGAFIKGNSYQRVDLDFYKNEGKLKVSQSIEEWYPAFGLFENDVKIDDKGKIAMPLGYGQASLLFDSKNLVLTGSIDDSNPTIYLQFKKVPTPPKGLYKGEPIQVDNGGVMLNGYLHSPRFRPTKTAIIIVGGRSCSPASLKYSLFARILREYGVTVLAYQKRGTGKSSGDCNKATIADLASDVVAMRKYLERQENKYENIGVIGSSAGGWVITKASETTDFDFMISIVGPSTSVRVQQIQSGKYGAEVFKLSPEAAKNVLEYTALTFDAPATQDGFEKFQALLAKAKEQKWLGLLDETDKPKSVKDIDNLWLRRHNYDPKEALKNFNKPYLAIFGEKDWIVPPKENTKLLKEFFEGERAKLLTVVTAYSAEHGTEVADQYVNLAGKKSYWRFFRMTPRIKIEIISFLEKNGFLGT